MSKKALWTKLPRYRKATNKPIRKRIAPRTSRRAAEETIYRRRVKTWLEGHPECLACPKLKLRKPKIATQCHHSRGRIAGLLLMEQFWIPVCESCHHTIGMEPNLARSLGLLCALGHWNTIPKDK